MNKLPNPERRELVTNTKSSHFTRDLLGAPVFWCLFLAVFFFAAYTFSGLVVMRTFETHEFFGVDHWEWVNQNWEMHHKGSHPLLVLFLKPFVAVVSIFPSLRGAVFQVVINAGFGGLAVGLAFLCFWNLGQRLVHSTVVASLYGCTTGQVVFGGIPDSRTIEASAIIATYVVFAVSMNASRIRLLPWLAAGLLTFGVTVTHFFHTLAGFVGSSLYLGEKRRTQLVLKFGGSVLLSALVLALVQKAMVPEAKLFFLPQTLNHEMTYTTFETGFRPQLMAPRIIKNFGFYNIVAPRLLIGEPRQLRVGTETVPAFADYIPVKPHDYDFSDFRAVVGLSLWVSLVLFGLFRNVRSLSNHSKRRTTVFVSSAAIAFFVVLHSLYGNYEVFLYYCSFTFPILLFVIDPEFKSKIYTGAIAALALIAGWNNWRYLLEVAFSVN